MFFLSHTVVYAQSENKNPYYPDVAHAYFESVLCSDSPQLSEATLWQARYFFAQLNVRRFEAPRGRSYNQTAYKSAIKQSDSGRTIYTGSCRNKQRHWLVTAPMPAGLVNNVSNERLYISPSLASSVCRNIRIDFAASQTTESKSLLSCIPAQCPTEINLDSLKDPGYLSMSCTQTVANDSTELWWLAPHRNPTMPVIKPRSLISWINDLRVQAKLSPLAETPKSVNDKTDTLASSAKLDHDLTMLQEIQKALAPEWRVLGEDRVMATSLQQAAIQLWRSPQHRALLVDPRATHLSVVTKASEIAKLYVLLVFQKP